MQSAGQPRSRSVRSLRACLVRLAGGRRQARRAATLGATASCVLLAPVAAAGSVGAAQGPCGWLESELVSALQQSVVVAVDGRERLHDDVRSTSCFLRTAEFDRSVSLEMHAPATTSSDGAALRWRDLFHRASAERASGGGKVRRFAGDAQPSDSAKAGRSDSLAIEGLGDEAFFVGTAAYGALYVLDGPVFFRLSVGGQGDLDAKLARARQMASHVVRRLAAVRTQPSLGADAGDRDSLRLPSQKRGAP